MAINFDAEIEAIKLAIASGATRISYDGKSVEYGTREDLLARLRWLQAQQSGGSSGRRIAGYASFDRGDC